MLLRSAEKTDSIFTDFQISCMWVVESVTKENNEQAYRNYDAAALLYKIVHTLLQPFVILFY